ncbi:MAG: hypothetical protein JXR79_01695, partial [Nitrospirae bacterium]|nr:hypothetical protein [Nitrospirota bacterium]
MTPQIPVIRGTRLPYLFPAVGSLILGAYGFALCLGLPGNAFSQVEVLPFLTYSFGTDGLSGFFIMIISAVSFCVILYCPGYYIDAKAGQMSFIFVNLFILSMYAVVASANVISFLIAWEAMSLISYFLITLKGDPNSAKSGLIYIVMTHIGTAFIILMFLLL